MKPILIATLGLTVLAACKDDFAAVPSPVKMTQDALGHYCQMNLVEHPGPKAQVHLKGIAAPLFFAQVRDAIAYQRMPEQSHAIAAIYVNDMSAALDWEAPGADNWIAASEAHFVIGSAKLGGMGAPETVPFADRDGAVAFAARHGGRVVGLSSISDMDVLNAEGPDASDESDFLDRLRRLEHQGKE